MPSIPQINTIIELIPITRKGKNILQNRINRWKVIEIRDKVICLDNGQEIFIYELKYGDNTPLNAINDIKVEAKWIKLPQDPDFNWKAL